MCHAYANAKLQEKKQDSRFENYFFGKKIFWAVKKSFNQVKAQSIETICSRDWKMVVMTAIIVSLNQGWDQSKNFSSSGSRSYCIYSQEKEEAKSNQKSSEQNEKSTSQTNNVQHFQEKSY